MSVLRILFAPFAWLHGVVLLVRHTLYYQGLFRSTSTRVPSIGVGNLALGGTGKTPHVELILRTMDGFGPIATLSRGYGRQGKEIRPVLVNDLAAAVGDEPLQLKRKFPAAHVWVGADRRAALERIADEVPGLQAVILDDAFQHRRVDASLDILLTTWHRPWNQDSLFPSGRLRDLPSRAAMADVVIVSKCPATPSGTEQQAWRIGLGIRPEQELFFSGIVYAAPEAGIESALEVGQPVQLSGLNCLLFTGIADPAPLVQHLHGQCAHMEHIAFQDHHPFSPADLVSLAHRFNNFAPGPKMLITTEKDAARLSCVIEGSPLQELPLATIRMKAVILDRPEQFAALIRDHVASHPAHR